jgi:hypothetical protein
MSFLSNEHLTQGPLFGARVLDLTTLFMGPTATQICDSLCDGQNFSPEAKKQPGELGR